MLDVRKEDYEERLGKRFVEAYLLAGGVALHRGRIEEEHQFYLLVAEATLERRLLCGWAWVGD